MHLTGLGRESKKGKMEMWKAFNEKYEVSSHGQVRNIKMGRILKLWTNASGYKLISVHAGGMRRTCLVHRMVASAFLEDWDPKLTVDHMDRNPSNNHLDNLRMATHSQQVLNRSFPDTLVGCYVAIDQFTLDGTLVACHKSLGHAARAVSVSLTSVNRAIKRKRTCAGYVWKYATSADLESEVWKHYDENVYVSNLGRVKRKKATGDFGIAKASTELGKMVGYPRVSVKGKNFLLHIAVAKLFLDKQDESKNIVNHKDGNKENAAAENLEWVTQSENVRHAFDTGLTTGRKPVASIDENGDVLETFDSITHASHTSRELRKTISRHLQNTVRVPRWKYV